MLSSSKTHYQIFLTNRLYCLSNHCLLSIDGEAVEYDIQQGANDSKIVAINVTGPNGADVLGTPQQPRTNSFSNDGGNSRGDGGRGGGSAGRGSRDRRDRDSDYY